MPSTYATGQLYSELGYTTVMQASTAPLMARHTHEELEDTPNVDNGAFMVMGNNHIVMQSIADKQFDRARDYVAWLLRASRGYAIKLVNPGGVENWKWGRNVAELDDEVIGYGVTPRQIMETLATIADDLGLPHAAHIHGINLGRHTSARTSIETIKALDGHRAHLCHLQFLSYGSGKGHVHASEAVAVAEAVNASPKLTVDVGQVVFGRATTMTCDGPLQHTLHNTAGGRWMNDDVEGESGGGIVPIEYKPGNPINATMWLTGLELFLLIDDPWKVFLTTDHPNAGTFSNYPQIIRLLMDRELSRGDDRHAAPARPQGGSARRAGPRVLAQRHRRHHPLRARARAGPQAQGPPRRRRRRRHRRVRGAGRQGGHVRPAAVRVQGRRARGPRRRRHQAGGGSHLLGGPATTTRASRTSCAPTSRRPTRSPTTTTPCWPATAPAPRPSPAAEGRPAMDADRACRPRRDTQQARPAVAVALSRAGVTNLRRIIAMTDGGKAELFYAVLDLYADLSPDQAGVHMSRFSEVVEDLAEGLTRKPFADIESLARRMAEDVVETQGALRAEVHIRAQSPITKVRPRSRGGPRSSCTPSWASPPRRARARACSSASRSTA